MGDCLSVDTTTDTVATSSQAKLVQDWLYGHGFEVPVKCVNGRLCVRISAHIYNDLAQYERLAVLVASAVGSSGAGGRATSPL